LIAADTNIWIAFVDGQARHGVDKLATALRQKLVRMVPVVVAELLSHPTPLRPDQADALISIPLLDLESGHWEPREAGFRPFSQHGVRLL
jgi:hypothetical protein